MMDEKPQFSLGYLMLEVFAIALAVGLTRIVVLNWQSEYMPEVILCGLAFIVDVVAIPTAFAGLFGRMASGVVCGLALLSAGVICLAVWALFLPAVE